MVVSRIDTLEDVDGDRGLVGGSSDTAFGGAGDELGDCSFDHARGGAQPSVGHAVVADVAADDTDEVDDGLGDHSGGLDELVAGGVQGDGEATPVGIEVGLVDGGVNDGCP